MGRLPAIGIHRSHQVPTSNDGSPKTPRLSSPRACATDILEKLRTRSDGSRCALKKLLHPCLLAAGGIVLGDRLVQARLIQSSSCLRGRCVRAADAVVVLVTPGDPMNLLATVKRVVDSTVTPTVATLVAKLERKV